LLLDRAFSCDETIFAASAALTFLRRWKVTNAKAPTPIVIGPMGRPTPSPIARLFGFLESDEAPPAGGEDGPDRMVCTTVDTISGSAELART